MFFITNRGLNEGAIQLYIFKNMLLYSFHTKHGGID
jgi:hypothetical protein